MILPDHELRAWAETRVTPYDPELINPASIDLRLGNTMCIPKSFWAWSVRELVRQIQSGFGSTPGQWGGKWTEPFEFDSYYMFPNDFVLCHSLEYTTLELNQVAMLYLKSSLGRIGLEHLHAGFGDPGFSGQWTFELKNVAPWPIKLVAGQRLMQLVVMRMSSPPEKGYGETGRYQGQMGPTEAR